MPTIEMDTIVGDSVDMRDATPPCPELPCLTFELDLRRINYRTWMRIGEAVSKCYRLQNVPMTPKTRGELNRVFLVRGVSATTRIEGNTLTEEEVDRIFGGESRTPESQKYHETEVRNILRLMNLLDRKRPSPSEELVMMLQSEVLRDLEVESHVLLGEYRKVSVGAGTHRGAPVRQVPSLVRRLFVWMRELESDEPDKQWMALLRALMAHLYLVVIHPFGDGNGRTSRLLETTVLLNAGFTPTVCQLFTTHYGKTRARYIQELDKFRGTHDPSSFIDYAMRGFCEQLREQVAILHVDQLLVAWESFVHEIFREKDKPGPTRTRRRTLVLDMPTDEHGISQPVPRSEITSISARVARMYATTGPRTLSRDLNHLIELGLLVLERPGVYRANTDRMLHFMDLDALDHVEGH